MSPAVESAFRAVDRANFVPAEVKDEAYEDRPVRREFVHLSAPHMYATVVEALAFEAGQSFLNVGSGTGYLSAVVAHLLGPTGVNHGIDIFPELVELAREAYRAQQQRSESKMCSAQFIAGNCFALSAALNRQYDRIYIGAAAPFTSKDFFCDFLRVGGVLVVRSKQAPRLPRCPRSLASRRAGPL